MKKYPRINGYRRKPDADMENHVIKRNIINYGKPCVICGKNTIGEKWVEVSYIRGEDETARVCAEHWGFPEDDILKVYHDELLEMIGK